MIEDLKDFVLETTDYNRGYDDAVAGREPSPAGTIDEKRSYKLGFHDAQQHNRGATP